MGDIVADGKKRKKNEEKERKEQEKKTEKKSRNRGGIPTFRDRYACSQQSETKGFFKLLLLLPLGMNLTFIC